ncbi:thiamine pyrophosphate-dependent dehydrogenase E1 component subunit alpha [Haliangium ochraceum]|uniref:2-oxoisovalerate dehydrogenase subunit alpha n=1 Tax=Haliangium ochraceum (strain DSM 14365 / JCM 11303 / SMP-2) TaxID=502025 RepID=D0LTP5_HALO1|nr:thiamine pyrophosphate-dependent enzyme [Haliangium ochraceum]ACY15739.1 3-methyl-2-oxobutanoate dehydrogenase (2- methylpropanoyl-transferring) [Haliangium ochraceum DSM 14365]
MVAVPTGDEPRRILDDEGALAPGADAPPLSDEILDRLFSTMLLVRRLDARMGALARAGRIALYVPSAGAEACVAAVQPLRDSDWVFPGYRDLGAWLWRGLSLESCVHQLFGSAEDAGRGRQLPTHLSGHGLRMMPVSGPVGTHLPQAAGAAFAAKRAGQGDAVLASFGAAALASDGCHAGLSLAGSAALPAIFVCTGPADPGIAERARGYGLESALVDGGDALAVNAAVADALARARAGRGATLVHAQLTDSRAQAQNNDGREDTRGDGRDPVARLGAYLERQGGWPSERVAQQNAAWDEAITAAIERAAQTPKPALESLFDDVYETPPWHLREQREALVAERREGSAD